MAAQEISCRQFTDYLSRKSEHLDEEIIKDINPLDTWIGHVETGRFPAQDGVSHTFDRFNRVYPDLSGEWTDVEHASCVGTPCDPDEVCIGIGYTRDEYHLEQKSYKTDLFCFDLILSADRAKQQFGYIVENLRDATNHIMSDRLKTEAFRIAGDHWLAGSGLTAFTYTEAGNLINVIPSALPTSKLTARHLQRRVHPQILRGALGKNPRGMPPMLELVTDMETLWELVEGNSELGDKWRFNEFDVGSKYYQYGWMGQIGNYAVRVDLFPIRFQINGGVLNRVFPYTNIAATSGIRGDVNDAYINAPVQANFIWHRRAMRSLVRDTTSIHPMMPFAARDFGGKWQFVMDNLGCAVDGTVIENKRRNKGMFIADFELATQKVYPEFAEVILSLREPACVVAVPPCADTPVYVGQEYGSCNDHCDDITAEPLPS
jgi:hypothetical protein